MQILTAAVYMVAASVLLGGCNSGSLGGSEPAGLTADEYQYKGAADPLLSTSATDRAGALATRFDLVQGRQ